MSNRSDTAFLIDIATAAKRAMAFVEGMDQEAFLRDLKTQAAVQHQLLIIGEAVKQLSQEFTSSIPEIPWSDIARMRDRLIHGYATVNPVIVWNTVSDALPHLLKTITPLLPTS